MLTPDNGALTGNLRRTKTSPESLALAIDILRQKFGERLQTSAAVREQHGNTLQWVANEPPDAVVFAASHEEVSEIVRVCMEHRVPMIPFGTGSSLEGHVNAPFGGISIDTSQMNAILAVNVEDLDCVVQPGVTRKQLNEHLRDFGVYFPIDPGADASLGGMVATRASGTNAVRYGTMLENVRALKVITPGGLEFVTARRAKKSSAGYDLTRLFVGSEGTLGVVTEITLKLQGIPEAVASGICPFPSVKAACDAVILAIQTGLGVSRIELLDALQVKACNAYSRLTLPETPMLFVEFQGTEAGVAELSDRFAEIAAESGGGPYEWATKTEDRNRLWQARHDAYWAAMALRSGCKCISTDVCVPISRLADCLEETQADLAATGLTGPIVGHVGDGNFHVLLVIDMTSDDEVASGKAFYHRLVERALSMGGTCTGEHGVGQGKRAFLQEELGADALEVMRAIKEAIDPLNIMNPGKITG